MQNKEEVEQLHRELERYLHISRIQSVVDSKQQELIDQITANWSNESWRMQQINTLNP